MSVKSEEAIGQALAGFDLSLYVEEVRAVGRGRLPPHTRGHASRLFGQVCEFRARRSTVTRRLDETLDLAQRVLAPEAFLLHFEVPNYRAYTNIGVLNWYLHTCRRAPYQEIWARCATAIKLLLEDQIAFEVNSLAGVAAHGAASLDPACIEARIPQLKALYTTLAGLTSPVSTHPPDSPPRAWAGYVSDERSAQVLLHLSALPQTTEHDEWLFLRAIHISECCFWGVLTATLAATESFKRGNFAVATQCMGVALPFAQVLTPLFRALKTMSPEHFRRFRDATGNASAVQSRTYQLMQIALTGVNHDTIRVVATLDDLDDLPIYDQPCFQSLAQLSRIQGDEAPGGAGALANGLKAVRKELYKWRSIHLGIARKYLADVPQGTGGTDGSQYLERSVRERDGLPSLARGVTPSPWAGVKRTRRPRPILAPAN